MDHEKTIILSKMGVDLGVNHKHKYTKINNIKYLKLLNGGRGGIRTHGELAPTAVFKTAALNHSATLPVCLHCYGEARLARIISLKSPEKSKIGLNRPNKRKV